MKAVIFISIMLTPMLIGCIHNYTVRPTSSADYASLNQHALRQQAIVTLLDGRAFYADKLQFAPDSTSWLDPNTRSVMAVHTTKVSDVRFVRRGRGALEGLGIGLLGGVLTGALIGLAGGDEPEDFGCLPVCTAKAKAFFGGITFGAIGGLIGLPIGAMAGSKDVYHIEPESPQSTTTTRK